MTIRVAMLPHVDNLGGESGMNAVIRAYFRYLPDYGIELVPMGSLDFDLRVVHAGATGDDCDICTLHGVYWTNDYKASGKEYSTNADIVAALRVAKQVTVPSEWVAETIRRDMRFNPHVIGHGIDADEWTPREHKEYVLWNKNRNMDVCDPTPMVLLAQEANSVNFVTTFVPPAYNANLQNIHLIGLQPHDKMKKLVEEAGVYLSTTKETFGIGVLEAMAAAVPVLGVDWGGNSELIQHGVTGYLAQPNNIEDLLAGLRYCMENRPILGSNAREIAKQYTWSLAAEKVANVYRLAMEPIPYAGLVSVVIPCYDYADELVRAVHSVLEQTRPALEIIIVDDGSRDNTMDIGTGLANKHPEVKYIRQDNAGVAVARNTGIATAVGEYIVCIDADDKIKPQFIEACSAELDNDRSLGIAYTGIWGIKADGKEGLTAWPGDCDYNAQVTYRSKDNARGMNQIPTCCMFRRQAWVRTGGYKSRYAPLGAGSEDADFWTRVMSIGYGAKKVTNAGLFVYSLQTGLISGNKEQYSQDLLEPPWLQLHPWAKDHKHLLASHATPINKRPSHPVRQYDQPVVSIIIPVGEGHEKEVYNALDTVEGQTFRKWEAIVVWDSPHEPDLVAYPYVRLIRTEGHRGAGFARNRGVEVARGGFVVFLDADDQLAPEFLDKTLSVFRETNAIVYTDYINSVVTTAEDLSVNFKPNEILGYNERTNIALISGHSADYDCERAQKQPSKDFFHWCLITCLIPKAWHEAIGGFDESMTSFEDVLYHWEMARSHCYIRLPEQLINYKLWTGKRREIANLDTAEGLVVAKQMIQYSQQVLKEIPTMAKCASCGGGRSAAPRINVVNEATYQDAKARETGRMQDDDYVMCEYLHPSKGNHAVQGAATKIKYNYRSGGEQFLVHHKDIAAQPHFFKPVVQSMQEVEISSTPDKLMPPPPVDILPFVSEVQVPSQPKPPPSPTPLDLDIVTDIQPDTASSDTIGSDIASLPGITSQIAEQLLAIGCKTKKDLYELDMNRLLKIKGIGLVRAEAIMQGLRTEFEIPEIVERDRTTEDGSEMPS